MSEQKETKATMSKNYKHAKSLHFTTPQIVWAYFVTSRNADQAADKRVGSNELAISEINFFLINKT